MQNPVEKIVKVTIMSIQPGFGVFKLQLEFIVFTKNFPQFLMMIHDINQ